uniref:Transcription factor bHLH143-like n=1 Tax=Nelumbo nucifera TaxID=4432 RepID=A0A822XT32_NELNU|nr:TPA_asm: hypothetical protein HUJ06_023529 [Nelumbo nucifera]
MGKDSGSWFDQQPSAWQSPNLNCSGIPLDPGRQDPFSAYANPYTYIVSTNGTLPGLGVSELPHLKTAQPIVRHGWFYCLPRYRQSLALSPNYVPKEKISSYPNDGCGGEAAPNGTTGSVQKRFLVFDQSPNQTSLIFSSVVGPSVDRPNSMNPKPFDGHNIHGLTTERDLICYADPIVSNGLELDDNHESRDRSEMHEDTEELDALLNSDDECEDDDEETSTGHSPSDMTVYEKPGQTEEMIEEVASSAKPIGSLEYEDDAESSCVKGTTGDSHTMVGNKRLRREKIRETVSLLQSIIPGGKGKEMGVDGMHKVVDGRLL